MKTHASPSTYSISIELEPEVRRLPRRSLRWILGVRGFRIALLTIALSALTLPDAMADWPQWRGPRRDGHTSEALPPRLPVEPDIKWRMLLGRGYAAPVIQGSWLVVLDDAKEYETVHCIDAETGERRWSTPLAPVWNDEFEPGPRCTPVIHEGHVYVQSNQGEFACLRLRDGRKVWGFSFSDYGTEWIPDRNSGRGAATRRGHTGSPVIHEDLIIVQVGSERDASMVAFNRLDGSEQWRSQKDLSAYSSPVVGTLDGRLQVVTATCEGLLGLSVHTGHLLWRVPFKTQANRNVLTPILTENGVVFASFTTGLQHYRIQNAEHLQSAELVWLNREASINLSTPVLVGQHLYGLGGNRNFICVNLIDGKTDWAQSGFGEVAATIASGDKLLVLLDTGECRLIRATPIEYSELGRFQACGKTFSHPAYSGGVVFVRDSRALTAYKLR